MTSYKKGGVLSALSSNSSTAENASPAGSLFKAAYRKESATDDAQNTERSEKKKKKSKKALDSPKLNGKKRALSESSTEQSSETTPAKKQKESKNSKPKKSLNPAELRISLKSKKRDKEQESRTVFVGDLPISFDKKKIKALFKPFGKVETIRLRSAAPSEDKLPKKAIVIKKMFNSKRKTINAFVVYVDVESVEKALSLNGHLVEGEYIRVDKSDAGRQHDHERSLFVGNLPFDVEGSSLRDHFKDCGDIESVRIVRDKHTGVGKGFGYILFKEKESVDLALCLREEKLEGRTLRLERSEKKRKVKKEKVKTDVKGNPKGKPVKTAKTTKALPRMPSNAKSKDFKGIKEQQAQKKAKKSKKKKVPTATLR